MIYQICLQVDQCYLSAFDETVEEMKESCPITCRGSSSDSEGSCSPPHADFLVGDEPVLVPLEEDLQDLRFTNDDNDESTAEQELTLTKTKEDVLDDAFYFYQGNSALKDDSSTSLPVITAVTAKQLPIMIT